MEEADEDAVEILKSDHQRVRDLFEKYNSAEESGNREEIAQDIFTELAIHARIEEQVFYPALKRAMPDMAGEIERAVEEHAEVKQLVELLQEMEEDHPEFDASMKSLEEAVIRHVRKEEEEVLPEAEAVLGEELDLLAAKMMQEKIRLLGPAKVKELRR